MVHYISPLILLITGNVLFIVANTSVWFGDYGTGFGPWTVCGYGYNGGYEGYESYDDFYSRGCVLLNADQIKRLCRMQYCQHAIKTLQAFSIIQTIISITCTLGYIYVLYAYRQGRLGNTRYSCTTELNPAHRVRLGYLIFCCVICCGICTLVPISISEGLYSHISTGLVLNILSLGVHIFVDIIISNKFCFGCICCCREVDIEPPVIQLRPTHKQNQVDLQTIIDGDASNNNSINIRQAVTDDNN